MDSKDSKQYLVGYHVDEWKIDLAESIVKGDRKAARSLSGLSKIQRREIQLIVENWEGVMREGKIK